MPMTTSMRNHHTRDRPRPWLFLLTLALAIVTLFAARPIAEHDVPFAATDVVLVDIGLDDVIAIASPVTIITELSGVVNPLNVLAFIAIGFVAVAAVARPYLDGFGRPNRRHRFDTYTHGRSVAAFGGARP